MGTCFTMNVTALGAYVMEGFDNVHEVVDDVHARLHACRLHASLLLK